MSFADVIATRVYMLDTTRWEDAARAHVEFVNQVRPALSFIGVANFFGPAILVEFEMRTGTGVHPACSDGRQQAPE